MAFVYFFCLHGAKVLVSLAERQKRNKQKTNTLAPWRHAIAKISFSLKNSQNWLFLGSNRGFGSTKIFIILVTYLVLVPGISVRLLHNNWGNNPGANHNANHGSPHTYLDMRKDENLRINHETIILLPFHQYISWHFHLEVWAAGCGAVHKLSV